MAENTEHPIHSQPDTIKPHILPPRSKGTYFFPPTKKPYAWLIYLYTCLYLQAIAPLVHGKTGILSDLAHVLALFPWIALIIQVVANAWRLFHNKSKLNLSKIAINIVAFIILGVIYGLLLKAGTTPK